jgi:DNA-directed RNA polymerase subunit RPC12/RpoP
MQVAYLCPTCSGTVRLDGVETLPALACTRCGTALEVPADAFASGDGQGPRRLARCLVCPSSELFLRKDFPQKLGVGIVAVGLLASCVTWGMRELVATFAVLFATALVDLLLYLFVPNCVACYRCGARYRGPGAEGFAPFDLETHERHRQQAARVKELSARTPAGS